MSLQRRPTDLPVIMGPGARSLCTLGRDDEMLCFPRGYRFGNRSKAGMPSGIWWKACLSTVKIAICGLP